MVRVLRNMCKLKGLASRSKICWQLQHDKSFRWDEILQVLDLPDASRSHELDLRCSHGQKIHHNDPRALKRRGCCANLKPSRLLSHSERFRSSLQGHSNYSTNTSPRSDLYMNLSMCTWICCFCVVCVRVCVGWFRSPCEVSNSHHRSAVWNTVTQCCIDFISFPRRRGFQEWSL